MQEILAKVMGYITGIWRFRWYAMSVAWVVCIIGWVLVFRLPDQWAANAKVYVDTQSMLRPLLQGLAINNNISGRVENMTKTLLTRPNLEKVARMTDMDLKVKDPAEMDQLINGLKKQIRIAGSGRNNIYLISYNHTDAQLTKRVVQAVLNIFVESTLGATRKDTDSAQQFLEAQIREYETRLVNAEERLKEFKRRHVGIMPGSGGGYYARMEKSQNQLRRVQLELRESEMRRDALQQQLESQDPTKPIARPAMEARGPSPTAAIDARIEKMTQSLDDLLTRYTEKHPDVISVKEQIAGLEEKRLEQLGLIKKDGTRTTTAAEEANPLYMEMKVALASAEAEVASLRVRSGEFERRVAALQEMVDTVPQVEADLKRLNRDYAVNKKQYDALLSRLEQARISQEAEQNSDNVKFRVIDPPRVPLKPTGPNRPLFLVAALIVGIGAGLGVALLMSLLRPTYDNRRVLQDSTKLPVLGTVTMVWTPAQHWRRRISMAGFLATATALIFLFAGVMVLELVGHDVLRNLPGVSRFL